MKILLVGEYSGLFNCLKKGLIHHGHTVFLASEGDGYRNYPSDFRWDKHINLKKFNFILDFLKILLNLKKFKGYDVVMFVSTRVFNNPVSLFINKKLYEYIIKHNKKSYICDSGLDYIGYRYWFEHPNLKYYNYVLGYYDEKKKSSWLLNKKNERYEKEIRLSVTGCIPIWYEYAQPYRWLKNLKPAIRIPIDLDKFDYRPNKVNGKIVFFHGLTRACKGGVYIQMAFDRLRDKYADMAEFICAGGLPFEEYMRITSKANVILDDVNSYSFSMNALFAMARGIIYMGGAEPEGNLELQYKDCPVINLTKNVDQICEAIVYVIEHKDQIEEMGMASRKFVEKYHNYLDVAQQYIDCWTHENMQFNDNAKF